LRGVAPPARVRCSRRGHPPGGIHGRDSADASQRLGLGGGRTCARPVSASMASAHTRHRRAICDTHDCARPEPDRQTDGLPSGFQSDQPDRSFAAQSALIGSRLSRPTPRSLNRRGDDSLSRARSCRPLRSPPQPTHLYPHRAASGQAVPDAQTTNWQRDIQRCRQDVRWPSRRWGFAAPDSGGTGVDTLRHVRLRLSGPFPQFFRDRGGSARPPAPPSSRNRSLNADSRLGSVGRGAPAGGMPPPR
jgi:hypothetical protein